MAQRCPAVEFEDIPLDQARTMMRGSRMDHNLYNALREKNQSLRNTAARMTFPEGTNPTTMKNRILRIAGELKIPVTIRKGAGGLLFWRSTDEDLQQAREIVQRLQPVHRRRPGEAGACITGCIKTPNGRLGTMMRLMVAATVFSVMILGVMVSSGLALDCHGRLVVVGQTPWEVRERCGEPDEIQHVTTYLPQRGYDHRHHRAVDILVPVEQIIWTYNFGSTRLLYMLTFQEGKLTGIRTGDYGQ